MGLSRFLCARLLAGAAIITCASAATAADGGWQAQGRLLTLSRLGQAQSSPPLRPTARLPGGAKVTSISWRINAGRPLPARAELAICMPGKCVKLDGLAGQTTALNGLPADNPVQLLIKAEGRGALTPPIMLRQYVIQVNYQSKTAY